MNRTRNTELVGKSNHFRKLSRDVCSCGLGRRCSDTAHRKYVKKGTNDAVRRVKIVVEEDE